MITKSGQRGACGPTGDDAQCACGCNGYDDRCEYYMAVYEYTTEQVAANHTCCRIPGR